MLSTYRAIVDDEGTIRLLEPVKLKEGTHVLVTVVDRRMLIWLFSAEASPAKKSSTAKCLCGCGDERNPESRFSPKGGHDATLRSKLLKIKRKQLHASKLPEEAIEFSRDDPSAKVVAEFTGYDILRLAGEHSDTFADHDSPVSYGMNDYRATVDDEGAIRLLEPVKLKESTHILVTLVDRDSLNSPMRLPGRAALSEERILEELIEDEAWAYLLKPAQS